MNIALTEPILNKTGLVAEKNIRRNGSYGIVGRAVIDNKEIVIKIILQESKDGLLYLSVLNMGELQIKKSMGRNLWSSLHRRRGPWKIDFVTQLATIPLLSSRNTDSSITQDIKKSITKSIDIW